MSSQQLQLARPLKHLLFLGYRLLRKTSFVKEILSQVPEDAWREYLIRDFIYGDYGAAYGISAQTKRDLVRQFERTLTVVPSGTSLLVHLTLARALLSVPPDLKGDVIECGVWKGASSCSLSLLCQLTGRRLLVCDSFDGLPDTGLELYDTPHLGVYGYLTGGMFRGRFDEVSSNIKQFGAIEVCDFVPGFFKDSLQNLKRPLVFAFLDVDRYSSTQECLQAIWPNLQEGSYLFSDDAAHMRIAALFFDQQWWQSNLACPAPGLYGAGSGLPLWPTGSSIGYTRKLSRFNPNELRRVSYLYYPEHEPMH